MLVYKRIFPYLTSIFPELYIKSVGEFGITNHPVTEHIVREQLMRITHDGGSIKISKKLIFIEIYGLTPTLFCWRVRYGSSPMNSGSFNSIFKVLFTFPSRYFECSSGFLHIYSFWGNLPANIQVARSSNSTLWKERNPSIISPVWFHLGDFHPF